jgi:cytochrome c oxidase accessory protein FixG
LQQGQGVSMTVAAAALNLYLLFLFLLGLTPPNQAGYSAPVLPPADAPIMDPIPLLELPPTPTMAEGKLHVRLLAGRMLNRRRWVSWPLLTLFFALVWVQSNGQPWLLFSFAGHRIVLFGSALAWQELPLLAGLMIAGACLLLVMAAVWGRIWCGFACPQSIWTWLFIRIEDWTEGSAHRRARAASQPLRGARLLRALCKHSLWLALAAATAITFTGYFVPIRELLTQLWQLQASPGVWGWLLTMTALTYLNAGLVREKICLHACPYARIQAVMIDRHTRTVAYDARRGEPRASWRTSDPTSGACVDCQLCVQVCPTGIDIRHGLQAACIDCGACIDACDSVMTHLQRPTGLIRFASAAALDGSREPHWRPRLLGYSTVLASTVAAVIWGFSAIDELQVDVRRDRSALFSQPNPHTVCNVYSVQVESFSASPTPVQVSLAEAGRFQLRGPASIDPVGSDGLWIPYRICTRDLHHARMEITFVFTTATARTTKTTTFLQSRPQPG